MNKIHWHPGFYGGMELELRHNKNDLIFETEHQLSKEPLKIDMLIIKKKSDVKIQNQIGAIFRKHNIVEYKSPEDGMTIDDYSKAVGYALLYKGLGTIVDEIPLDELTVSLVRDTYPIRLMESVKAHGGVIEEHFPGIYYITGIFIIPTQVVVTGQLLSTEHSFLRVLSKNAKEEDVLQFLKAAEEISSQGDKNNVSAVLQVSSSANEELYDQIRRDNNMFETLKEIMKDDFKETAEKASEETTKKHISTIMKKMNITAEEAMDILEVPLEERKVFLVQLNK